MQKSVNPPSPVYMSNEIKPCVTINSCSSEFFKCQRGVRHGENLFPLLFSIYWNDQDSSPVFFLLERPRFSLYIHLDVQVSILIKDQDYVIFVYLILNIIR